MLDMCRFIMGRVVVFCQNIYCQMSDVDVVYQLGQVTIKTELIMEINNRVLIVPLTTQI